MNSSSFDSFLTTNPFQSLRSLRWWWWLLTECWRLLAPSSPISRWRRRWTTRRGTWRASVSALANRKNWKKYSYISIYTYIYIHILKRTTVHIVHRSTFDIIRLYPSSISCNCVRQQNKQMSLCNQWLSLKLQLQLVPGMPHSSSLHRSDLNFLQND